MNRLRLRDLKTIASLRLIMAARRALVMATVLLLAAIAQSGQNAPHLNFPPSISQPRGGGIGDIPAGDTGPTEEQLRVMNRERQRSLVFDANKLLKLAGELDAEVRDSAPDSLTPNQERKLAEIEKLAHNVKDKMSYSVRTGPVFRDPLGPINR